MKLTKNISRTVLSVSLLAPLFTHAGELTIDVKGLGSDKGSVLVAIYDKADTWMKTPVGTAQSPAKKDGVTVTIKDLADGEYAASLFHDENGNGKLDSNAIGMPIEPFGFSNDASGKFGPPPFEKAKFKLDANKKNIVVNLK